jgi:hypothetical protein
MNGPRTRFTMDVAVGRSDAASIHSANDPSPMRPDAVADDEA